MAYPQQSNFRTSADQFSAYWGAETAICTTSSHDLVRQIRRAFGLSDAAVWDANLLRAVAESVGAPIPSAITNDFIRLAIWSAFYRRRNVPIGAIFVSPDAVLPQLNVVIAPNPEQRSLGIVCFNPTTDRNPATLDPSQVRRFDPMSVPYEPQQSPLVPIFSLILLVGVIAVGATAVAKAGK